MAVTIDGSAGVTTNAGGSVNPSTNVEGINYSCRAWVNFNGTGTVAIRASGNVTSITDNGTGNYTLNFTTALTDTNYGISSFVRKDNSNADAAICAAGFDNGTKTTSAFQIMCLYRNASGQGAFDSPEVGVSIFR